MTIMTTLQEESTKENPLTSRDGQKVAQLAAGAAVDAVLAAGEQLPVVGGFVSLLSKLKDATSQ